MATAISAQLVLISSLLGKEMEKGTVVDHSRLFDLPMVRQCLLAASDPGSRFHALKGNHHLTELLIKKHVLPEAEALSLFDAASKGDLRAVHLVLNWTMTPVDLKNARVSACRVHSFPLVPSVRPPRRTRTLPL